MSHRIKSTFFLLIIAQGLHSIEEYAGKLWEEFPPARYVTGLVSPDHREGFIIINILLFLFGLWCWMIPVRKNYSYAGLLIYFWIAIEFINGIGHPLWSLLMYSYTPGLITSFLLLALSVGMMILLFRNKTPHSEIN